MLAINYTTVIKMFDQSSKSDKLYKYLEPALVGRERGTISVVISYEKADCVESV